MTETDPSMVGEQSGGLQAAGSSAANSLRAATDAMRARFAGLGDAARQAQLQLAAAAAQIRSALETLQRGATSLTAAAEQIIGAPPEAGMPPDRSGSGGAQVSSAAATRLQQNSAEVVEDALTRSLTGIVIGTTTARNALSGLLRSLLRDLVGSAVRSLFDAIGGGAETGLIGALLAGLGSIFSFSRGGIVPSAAGGWAVPSLGPGGIVARLHSHEMVLPAEISRGLQNMIAGGTPGHVFNIGISAIDAAGVAKLFTSNGAALVAALNKALRNGSALYES